MPRDVIVPGAIEGIGDRRAVARPGVRVCVAGELTDVEVGRGDDGAMVVRMGARGEDAPPVELRDVGAELLVDVAMILLGPHLPISLRASLVNSRPATHHQILSVRRTLAQPRAHAEPLGQFARFARGARSEVEADRAIDRSLLDRVAAEHAVLGVDPGPGEPVALLAVGPGVDPELGAGHHTTDEKVAVAFVGDHAAMSRVVSNGVADVRTLDVPVVVEEDTSDLEAGGAPHLRVSGEPVACEVAEIRELDGDPQRRVLQPDAGNHRILPLPYLSFPAAVSPPA